MSTESLVCRKVSKYLWHDKCGTHVQSHFDGQQKKNLCAIDKAPLQRSHHLLACLSYITTCPFNFLLLLCILHVEFERENFMSFCLLPWVSEWECVLLMGPTTFLSSKCSKLFETPQTGSWAQTSICFELLIKLSSNVFNLLLGQDSKVVNLFVLDSFFPLALAGFGSS